ncbi:MAG: RES family NAD+ phosphorylase [Gemmatimonadales bacterium]|nr:RES family NAD+ phosphorylase [Gemmatimonadales bacterium]MDQ3426667.1 RES family NAD+ phosphorylase [Gemmatimonadota bacterium]
MSEAARKAWRCFPWDPGARDGTPFSSSYLPPGQTIGRFDLQDRPPVRYLAESPDHALGEALGPFRGTRFRSAYLRQGGHQFALVEVSLAPSLVARIPDCTDPEVLKALGLQPDELAHHDRSLTQAIARRLHDLGAATGSPSGLRWWSALTGAWHTVVVFTDRARPGEVKFGAPEHLRETDPQVVRALSVLGIRRY